MAIELVFDHPNFLVADKPAAYLTVPSRYEKNDQRKVLGRELERITQSRLFPVHRLDFEVSGLVIFAKDAETQKLMNRQFENREVEKTYEAWTGEQDFSHWPPEIPFADGFIALDPQKIYTWHCRILRGKKRSYESPAGEESVTNLRFLEIDKNGFLHWQVMPLTGRPHQIRFEMSRHGLPILGDILYGSKQAWKPNEIALRAVKLKMKKIFSDMPTEFVAKGLEK